MVEWNIGFGRFFIRLFLITKVYKDLILYNTFELLKIIEIFIIWTLLPPYYG